LVKPISNIVIIRDEQDIYNILTDREKLECLLQEYENNQLEQQIVCCDENTPCVLTNNSNNNDELLTNNNLSVEYSQSHWKDQDNVNYSHKGKNRHSKINTVEDEELDLKYIKSGLKEKIKEKLEKSDREQQILLKQNKQNIIYFLLDNKDSIRIEDLKIYESIYKCYSQKGHCYVCKSLTNIICVSCNNYDREVWLCTNHWQDHLIDKHQQTE
jgi:hypothetical protein